MVIHSVRRFVQEEIIPLERELDPDAYELPAEHHKRLVEMTKAMGLYQMGVPKEYGGPGVDVLTRTLVTEEMAQHRMGLALAVRVDERSVEGRRQDVNRMTGAGELHGHRAAHRPCADDPDHGASLTV